MCLDGFGLVDVASPMHVSMRCTGSPYQSDSVDIEMGGMGERKKETGLGSSRG